MFKQLHNHNFQMRINKKLFLLPLTACMLALGACGGEEDQPQVTPPGSGNNSEAGGDIPTQVIPTQIIYQANPRFFASNGSLKEIENQLPRISGMGCDVLWLMPIFEPGELKSVGSPYCIRDFKKINPRYGSDADLRSLVNKAHSMGMKVILDWVANHTSFDNVWTVTNPERYRKDANGNIAATQSWGDVAQLDYSVASTAEGMTDALLYWVENFDIDGYRCDYAEGVPHDYWKSAITRLRQADSELIMLAEASKKDFYGDGFDMIYDWSFAPALSKVYAGSTTPAKLISDAAATITSLPQGKSILRYAFNHDVAAENEVDKYFGSFDGVKGAYLISTMLGGTPMIYSGMDVDNVRGKLNFFNYSPKTFSSTLSDEYGKINKIVKATENLRAGKLTDYSKKNVVAFTLASGNQTMLVIVNTSGSEIDFRTPITMSGEQMTDMIADTDGGLPVSVTLPAYGYKIYLKK